MPEDDVPPQNRDMTTSSPAGGQPNFRDGPFVLRTLLADVPVSADGTQQDITITCVEYLGSASPLLSHTH